MNGGRAKFNFSYTTGKRYKIEGKKLTLKLTTSLGRQGEGVGMHSKIKGSSRGGGGDLHTFQRENKNVLFWGGRFEIQKKVSKFKTMRKILQFPGIFFPIF